MSIKIFFPCENIQTQSGFLIGKFYSAYSCYYILSVVPFANSNAIFNDVHDASMLKHKNYEILGLWWCHNNIENHIFKSYSRKSCKKEWIILKKQMHCINVAFVKAKREVEVLNWKLVALILFKNNYILNSRSIYSKMVSVASTSKTQTTTNVKCEIDNDFTHLCQSINLNTLLSLYSETLTFHDKKKKQTAFHKSEFVRFITGLWIKLLFIFTCGANNFFRLLQIFEKPAFTQYARLSSTGTHIFLKVRLLLKLCSDETTYQEKLDIILAFFCDAIFGIVFFIWLYYFSQNWFFASGIVMPSVDYIAKQVERLIMWLMGIPIGLKLNSPLNQFLGKFFLHHVHIWLEYIQMIINALTNESWISFSWLLYISCLAMSFSIAILSDILSLLTFHVYCFYVYATRLYGLQIAGLKSFWRLFRGKKWNPLRMRVDTLPHSPNVANHRFYTGTLLFTILLFLLPTTALYYAIFALLRVVIWYVQKLLYTVAVYIACFPWFSLLARLIKPLRFASHARFNHSDVFQSKPLRNCFLSEDCLPSSLCLVHAKDVKLLEMLLDVQPVGSVVYSGLKKAALIASMNELNFRQITASVLSGTLLK